MPSSEITEHVARLYRAIYAVVRRIPRGQVATYGQVAELAGIPGGARVAGAAMKMSSQAPGLPWQRVIGKASRNRGRIAIQDPVGAAVQRQLLDKDGVEIGDTGLVALDRYGWLPVGDNIGRRARRNGRGPERTGTRRTTGGSDRGASLRRQPRSGSKTRASSLERGLSRPLFRAKPRR